MANMVSMNEGRKLLLNFMMKSNGADFEDWVIRLYSNDFTPALNSTEPDFVNAFFSGYEDFEIARGDFDVPFVFLNIAFTNSLIVPQWTHDGGGVNETVFGWYMLGKDTNVAYFAQRFDVPRLMAPGTTLFLSPFAIAMKDFF